MKEKINKNIYFYLLLIACIAALQVSWKVLTSFFSDIPAEYGSRFNEVFMCAGAFFSRCFGLK